MFKSVNISKEWANSVTYTKFKQNSIVARLDPEQQQKLFEDLTGKKIKIKAKED